MNAKRGGCGRDREDGRKDTGHAEQMTRDGVTILLSALLTALLWAIRLVFAVGRGTMAAIASFNVDGVDNIGNVDNVNNAGNVGNVAAAGQNGRFITFLIVLLDYDKTIRSRCCRCCCR